jgi:hypothetical protein
VGGLDGWVKGGKWNRRKKVPGLPPPPSVLPSVTTATDDRRRDAHLFFFFFFSKNMFFFSFNSPIDGSLYILKSKISTTQEFPRGMWNSWNFPAKKKMAGCVIIVTRYIYIYLWTLHL